MLTDEIHHYTDINTLALILDHRTIRFNRLDNVDDVTEGDTFSRLKLEQFFFVSCWTYDQNESLPQWNMYTPDMAGVRITLPRRMFDYKPLIVPKTYRDVIQQGELISPISFEKIFGDNYFVPPIFLNERHFGRKVEYYPDFVQRKNQAIEFDASSNGEMKVRISDLTGIAALKSPDWEFQREYRFVLFIVPSFPASEDADFQEQFYKKMPDIVVTSLYKGQGPDLAFFDVNLSQVAIDSIRITTGPCCSEGDYLTVEALLDKYSPNGTTVKSKFEGKIRRPRRKWSVT
jgi:hypothetical protein